MDETRDFSSQADENEKTDSIKFYCVACSSSIRIATSRAGETIDCPGCGAEIAVPESITSALELGAEQKKDVERIRGRRKSDGARTDGSLVWAVMALGAGALVLSVIMVTMSYPTWALVAFIAALFLLFAALWLGRKQERDYYERFVKSRYGERVMFNAEGYVSGNPMFENPRVPGRFVLTPERILHFQGKRLIHDLRVNELVDIEMGSEEKLTLKGIIAMGVFGTSAGSKHFLVRVTYHEEGFKISLVYDFIKDVMGNIFFSKLNHLRYRSHISRRSGAIKARKNEEM